MIDEDTRETLIIPCASEGDWKWLGIAQCGTILFHAPGNASAIIAIKDYRIDLIKRNIVTLNDYHLDLRVGNRVGVVCERNEMEPS